MTIMGEDILKLVLAVLVGGVIGTEREFRDKSAGFRTMIFVTFGATLFTMLSFHFLDNSARVAANIVTGIGFLGAGAILRGDGGKIAGLTTASTIWLVAALGMGIGSGLYLLVGASTLIVLLVLWVFPLFEHWLDNLRDSHVYCLAMSLDYARQNPVEEIFRSCGVRVYKQSISKQGGQVRYTLQTIGRRYCHRQLISRLMDDDEILEFQY